MSDRAAHSWILRQRPEGMVDDDTLEYVTRDVPALQDGQVLVRTQFLSLDATNRIWMSDMKSYLPPVAIDDPMRGVIFGEVEESRSDAMPVGTTVTGLGTWSDRFVADAASLSAIPPLDGVDPSQAFALSSAGPTAMVGLKEIGGMKGGETVVVSAAAGSVGILVGQIAKAADCRVIGIAGGPEKCAMLTEEFGFDAAVDYKNEKVANRLGELAPDGIDILFENVGGKILDASLANMKNFGTIVLCGLISSYNATEPVPGPYHFSEIVMRRLNVRGFIVMDHMDTIPAAMMELFGLVMQGKVKMPTEIVDGLENAPRTLNQLYTGGNVGKLMIRV